MTCQSEFSFIEVQQINRIIEILKLKNGRICAHNGFELFIKNISSICFFSLNSSRIDSSPVEGDVPLSTFVSLDIFS